jgi:hypothetical protein
MRIDTSFEHEVAYRQQRLLAAAAQHRMGRCGISRRQRVGLGLVRLGMAVAGRMTVATVIEGARPATQPLR